MYTIRQAAAADAAALLAVYAPFIDTPITFETAPPSVTEFEARIRGTLGSYPYLVCEAEGRVAGYAYAHRFRERPAYQWGAELSVYVDRELCRRGIGRALYTALTGLLKLQNVKTVYGAVTLPNAASEGLHRALGFQTAGVYHSCGYKCGQWHDVAWFEKKIGEYEAAPTPFLPFEAVDAAGVSTLLRQAEAGIGKGGGPVVPTLPDTSGR